MKKFAKTLKRYWLIWLILAIVVVFVGAMAIDEGRRWLRLRGEITSTQERISETQEHIDELATELELVTDPEYLEREARRTLNVKREGEEVFAVVGLEDAKEPENFSLRNKDVRVEQGGEVWENVKSWWAYFFK